MAAVDELRESAAADLPARRALIEKLEKLPASTPLARSARDECVKAYRALVDGKEAVAKFKHVLDDPKASAKDLGDLAGTEDLITRSEEAMPACNKAADDLSLYRREAERASGTRNWAAISVPCGLRCASTPTSMATG